MTELRDRLRWPDGAITDGPRRYLMMRPDVLMGAVAALDGSARDAFLCAWAQSAREFGGASLQAYARSAGADAQALTATTVAAAADLGWGRWTVQRQAWGWSLDVVHSPFVDGWRSAAAGPAPVPVCAPVRGLFGALVALLQPGAVTVDETRCAAMHADGGACRFEARAIA